MVKKIGYYLFAVFFTVYRIFPVQRKKVFFVATHDDSDEGNIGIVAAAIREKMPEMKLYFLTKRDGIRHPVSFFFRKAYHLATAGTIFLDNVFMPMAFTPVSPKVKVVQLWHGTESVKKFGQDADTGEVKRLSKKSDGRITHLIVNSQRTKRQYAGAFALPEEKAYVLGLPRTDLILDRERMEEKKRQFYERYPELKGKRCTLYAPTFRDAEVENPTLALDLEKFLSIMGKEDALLLRLHPHVSANFSAEALERYENRIVNVSDYPGVATLLAVSDCLISDYSSIIFEYCLFGRPMIFYAYDLESFEREGRSFYEDYETFVPGPIARSQHELEAVWQSGFEYKDRIDAFKKETYEYLDKNATNRLLELIF